MNKVKEDYYKTDQGKVHLYIAVLERQKGELVKQLKIEVARMIEAGCQPAFETECVLRDVAGD